jgi:hypothetical protein
MAKIRTLRTWPPPNWEPLRCQAPFPEGRVPPFLWLSQPRRLVSPYQLTGRLAPVQRAACAAVLTLVGTPLPFDRWVDTETGTATRMAPPEPSWRAGRLARYASVAVPLPSPR